MKLQIRNYGVELTEELRDALQEQIRRALRRFAPRVSLVRVYLRDVNGPRGGAAFKCRIVVELPPRGRVVVAEDEVSVAAALAGASNHVRLAVARQLKRRTGKRRPSRRRLAATAA